MKNTFILNPNDNNKIIVRLLEEHVVIQDFEDTIMIENKEAIKLLRILSENFIIKAVNNCHVPTYKEGDKKPLIDKGL